MNGKYYSLIFGIILGVPAFFNDNFAGYLLNLSLSLGFGDINIFVYPFFVILIYSPVFLLWSYLLSKFEIEHSSIIKNFYLNIVGCGLVYFVYMIFAIFSLRNLVGGL